MSNVPPPPDCVDRNAHNTDLLHAIADYHTGRTPASRSPRLLRSHKAMVYRLRPVPVSVAERTNIHHTGCVNRLCWSINGGALLGSISDDRTIRLWALDNAHTLKRKQIIPTSHQGNMFGIRFLQCSSDTVQLATGARDGTICVTLAGNPATRLCFTCHNGSVMEIEQSLDQPSNVFWSASEDNTVRQWDLRCQRCCRCRNDLDCNASNILIDGRHRSPTNWKFSSICASPVDSNIILTGSDQAARIFDRRMLSVHSPDIASSSPPVQQFVPSYLKRTLHNPFVTHTSFSPCGRRIVVSYNGDHAYVFNLGNDADSRIGLPMVSPSDRYSYDADNLFEFGIEQAELSHWDNVIHYYSVALSLPNVPAELQIAILIKRSIAFQNRRWLGDSFAALRDAEAAMSLLNGVHDTFVFGQLMDCLDDVGDSQKANDLRASVDVSKIPSSDTLQQDAPSSPSNSGEGVTDYCTRLVGHANVDTGIKEATFLTSEIVACASDDGIVFVYDVNSGIVLNTLGDGDAETQGLNCVRGHPELGVSCVATSGLDHHIQLYTASGAARRAGRYYNSADQRYMVTFNQETVLGQGPVLLRQLLLLRHNELQDLQNNT